MSNDLEPQSKFLIKDAQERAERKLIRAKKRAALLLELKNTIALESLQIAGLRKYAFADEAELEKAGLTKRERALVRQWENPKRSTAFAVEAATQHVSAMLKASEEKSSITLNVQNAIVLPEKQPNMGNVVVIDVEAKRE